MDSHKISLLKLRASYGVLGNENIGEYQYMDTMMRGNYTYSFGGNKVTGSAISNYVNTAIRWEKKSTGILSTCHMNSALALIASLPWNLSA